MNVTISPKMYDIIASQMEAALSQEGYQRSGKSLFFYRYHFDKRVACVIGVQKSICNVPDCMQFTMNLGCVSIDELPTEALNGHLTLTLSILKEYLRSVFSMRIGMICRGGDFWYELLEYSLMGRDISQYYTEEFQPDLKQSIEYMDTVLDQKAKRYAN